MTELHIRTGAAVRAEHAVKVYGTGDTAVAALDDVTVEFPAGRFTAIMGPSGSGKSTLLHCLAGLDSLTAGRAFVGDAELGRLSDRQLTLLRRDRIGFVFQAFNLVPTLSARDNITLPMTLAGTAPDPDWLATVIERTGLADRLGTARPSSPAASSSGSRWPGRWPPGRRSCSPTSRPATSTRAAGTRCWSCCARPGMTSARRS